MWTYCFLNHHAKELPRLNTSNLLLTQSIAYDDLSGLSNFLYKYHILYNKSWVLEMMISR